MMRLGEVPTVESVVHDTAKLDGIVAYATDKPFDQNPFRESDPQHKEWAEGWLLSFDHDLFPTQADPRTKPE